MDEDLRAGHVLTSGTSPLDSGAWDIDNNVWVLDDDRKVIVIDTVHEAQLIIGAVDSREVKVIMCTHAHNDHVTVAPELQEKLDAPLLIHPGDQMLWEQPWPDLTHKDLAHGQRLEIAGTEVVVINTPGHFPGSCCLCVPKATKLFSGDTLPPGGPGVTGRSYSDLDTIISPIRDDLLAPSAETTVRTGHNDHTMIGHEAPHLEEWTHRGY